MSGTPETLALFAIVFAPMLVEAVRASRHERAQRARGGIEPPGDVYAVMQVVYPAAFLAMIVEGAWRQVHGGASMFDTRLGLAGLALFAAAKALKWWAIVSLGPAWTFRVIVVPGDVPVVSGPYVWLRHPNYVAVAGEMAGVALMAGARVSGPIGTLAFCVLMLRRIAVEERALHRA